MKQARSTSLACSTRWDVTSFENVAVDIDAMDEQHGSNYAQVTSANLHNLCRLYLISAGIDNGIRYVFTMNPLMSEVHCKNLVVTIATSKLSD